MQKRYFIFVWIFTVWLVACQPTAVSVTTTSSAATAESTPEQATATALPTEVIPVMVQVNDRFTIGLGETAVLADNLFTLTFTELLEESRCPTNVQCVEAGQARIAVAIQQPGQTATTYELNTNPPLKKDHIQFLNYDIQLVDLSPYPADLNQSIPASDYHASFVITSAAMATATPSSTNSVSQTIQIDIPFTLGFGKTAVVENSDVSLQFTDLLEDSRCPKDVDCVWAGQVKIVVTLQQTGQEAITQELILPNPEELPQVAFAGYTFQLTEVSPYPVSTVRQEISSYQATFVVTQP